jgi:type IV secretion system protein VirB9
VKQKKPLRTFAFSTALACGLMVVLAARADPRIRIQPYDRDAVTAVTSAADHQVMIEFAPGEHIENVAVGDASRWQVTPNRRAEILFVKALFPTGRSNMTVVTDRRRYLFDLVALPATAKGAIYNLRFGYKDEPLELAVLTPAGSAREPAPAATPSPLIEAANPIPRQTRYSYTGSQPLAPLRVYDDGQSTYFRWSSAIALPSIAAINGDGREEIVSPVARGDDLVVDLVAPGFVLRSGDLKLRLYNDGFKVEAPDVAAPVPRASPAEPTPSKGFGIFGFLTRRTRSHDG